MISPIPTAIAFEPINLCNAKCFCCPYTEYSKDKSYTSQKMSVEQITELMNDFGRITKKYNLPEWSTTVMPWRYSDPLVNPNLRTVFSLANKHKIRVNLTTNAVSFVKRQCDIIQRYIHCMSDPIFVSIIGYTEEEVWDQMKLRKQKVIKSLIYLRDNYPQISKLLKVTLKNKNQTKRPSQELIKYYQSLVLGFVKPKTNWMSNRLGKGDGVWMQKFNWKLSPNQFVKGCRLTPDKILNRLELLVNGNAVLCCEFTYHQRDYGNVFDIGIEGVWKNLTKEHELIYDTQWSEKKKELICNDCSRIRFDSDIPVVNRFQSKFYQKYGFK